MNETVDYFILRIILTRIILSLMITWAANSTITNSFFGRFAWTRCSSIFACTGSMPLLDPICTTRHRAVRPRTKVRPFSINYILVSVVNMSFVNESRIMYWWYNISKPLLTWARYVPVAVSFLSSKPNTVRGWLIVEVFDYIFYTLPLPCLIPMEPAWMSTLCPVTEFWPPPSILFLNEMKICNLNWRVQYPYHKLMKSIIWHQHIFIYLVFWS